MNDFENETLLKEKKEVGEAVFSISEEVEASLKVIEMDLNILEMESRNFNDKFVNSTIRHKFFL